TQLIGIRGHAAVGRERRNPLIASDQRDQTLEPRRERLIEVEIEILNLLAARSERMADEIGAREAHPEEIGPIMPTELEPLDQCGGKAADKRVGERAAQPLREKAVVGLSHRALQRVRKRRRPPGRRRLAGAIVGGRIARWRKEAVPDLAEISGVAV